MGLFQNFSLVDILLRLPAVLWAISFHEFCHGWVAYKLGDRTAAAQGRLSLNPLDHLDPIGTLMLIFVGFGWAKPVPINTRYFKNPRKGIILVSLAGVAGNFLTALVCGILIKLAPGVFLGHWAAQKFIFGLMAVNIGLGVFNLIPIPPLDGSKILGVMLPPSKMDTFFLLERYGMIIIAILLFSGVLNRFMYPIYIFLMKLFLFQF